MRPTYLPLAVVAALCLMASKCSTGEDDQFKVTEGDDEPPIAIVGTVSIETTVAPSTIKLFTPTATKEPTELAVSTTSAEDGSFRLEVDAGKLGIETDATLITMS